MNKLFKSCLLIVNRECNLDCKCCASKKNIPNAPWKEVRNAVQIINRLTDFTVIMGGEPLLYENLYKLIRFMSSLDMDFTIITNGSLLTDDVIDMLICSGLKNITVSYDYYKGLTLDEMISLRDRFEDVSINIMYDGTLVGKMGYLIKQLSNNGIWSIIALYNFSTNYREHYLIGEKIENGEFRDYQAYSIECEIEKLVNNFNDLLIHNSVDYIRDIPKYLHLQNWHCNYPHRLVVNNDLKIMPCEDYEPFEDIDIFRLNELIILNKFDLFLKKFKDAISNCKGCYLPCYYDIESLTPLEIAHKGGKNVNYNETGLSLCARSKKRQIAESEDHVCWFCGSDIRISSSYETFCKKCGLMKCTSCGKCFCDGTELEKEFLRWINKTYCGDADRLVLFRTLDYSSIPVPERFNKISKKMIKNANKCLQRCSAYMRGLGKKDGVYD